MPCMRTASQKQGITETWCWQRLLTKNSLETGDIDMNFGLALNSLKHGLRVARVGWNGKGMWLALSPGCKNLSADTFWSGPIREFAHSVGGSCNVLPNIMMKTADIEPSVVPWLASQTDILAEDWEVVE
jgi:hypothetical protein